MTTTEAVEVIQGLRRELKRRTDAALDAVARAVAAEDRLRVAEDERDRYARMWAQAEAARMAAEGEGPFARQAHDVGAGTTNEGADGCEVVPFMIARQAGEEGP